MKIEIHPQAEALLRGVIHSLMLCENLGDVHDEIVVTCNLLGIEPPRGDFMDGWDDGELERING